MTVNQAEELDQAHEFFKSCCVLLAKKAHDYAKNEDCFSNFKKIAEVCEVSVEKVFLIFIMVKVARLVELTKKENIIAETKQDSLKDISNYACLMSTYIDDIINTKQ